MKMMRVKTDLASVRSAIRNCIRDGVKIDRPYQTQVEQLEMRECRQFETAHRSLWAVGHSAIEAIHLSPGLTQLKLLPVKHIYHDGVAGHAWEMIREYFKDAELTDSSASLGDEQEIVDVVRERDLLNSARPGPLNEKALKNRWLKLYGLNLMTDEERERNIEQNFEVAKRSLLERQARWDEIHFFDDMTTEDAIAFYLAEESTPTSQEQKGDKAGDARKAEAHTEPPPMQVKPPQWLPRWKLTTDQKIAIVGVVITMLICVAAWLVVPQVQEIIQRVAQGVLRTLTPALVLPTATPRHHRRFCLPQRPQLRQLPKWATILLWASSRANAVSEAISEIASPRELRGATQ